MSLANDLCPSLRAGWGGGEAGSSFGACGKVMCSVLKYFWNQFMGLSVVYFDQLLGQLLGAARTQKLVEIHNI